MQDDLVQMQTGCGSLIATQKRSERQAHQPSRAEWYCRAQPALQQQNEPLARKP